MVRWWGLPVLIAVAAVALPAPAQAWWVRGGYWGPRVVVGPPVVVLPPPPVVYAPPPVVAYAPRPRVWVRGHVNRFGYWVPSHWA